MTGPDPDGPGSQTSPVTEWDYDDAGHLTSMTEFAYDDLHRLIEEEWLDGETVLNTFDYAGKQRGRSSLISSA